MKQHGFPFLLPLHPGNFCCLCGRKIIRRRRSRISTPRSNRSSWSSSSIQNNPLSRLHRRQRRKLIHPHRLLRTHTRLHLSYNGHRSWRSGTRRRRSPWNRSPRSSIRTQIHRTKTLRNRRRRSRRNRSRRSNSLNPIPHTLRTRRLSSLCRRL
jgi:hypothetical protein